MKKILQIIAILVIAAMFAGCEAPGSSSDESEEISNNIEPVQVNINLYSPSTQNYGITTNQFGEVTLPPEE